MSAITLAVAATPRRLADAWRDPVRRRHTVSRVLETWVPATAAFWLAGHGWLAGALWAALVVGLAWLLYEWLLEPLGTPRNPVFSTGPYWERGPRDDEEFTRP